MPSSSGAPQPNRLLSTPMIPPAGTTTMRNPTQDAGSLRRIVGQAILPAAGFQPACLVPTRPPSALHPARSSLRRLARNALAPFLLACALCAQQPVELVAVVAKPLDRKLPLPGEISPYQD